MKKILLLSFAVIALSSCKSTMRQAWNHFPNQINLSEYNNLQFVKVKQGSTVTVHVDENASTGYAWATESEKDCSVDVKTGSYTQGKVPVGMVGAPGVRNFEVSGKSKGSCLVEFQLKAPGSNEISERKAIYFIVE